MRRDDMMIARVEGQGNAPVVPSARIMCNTQSTVLAPTSTRRGRQGLLEIGECYVNLDHFLFRYELLIMVKALVKEETWREGQDTPLHYGE